MSRIYKLIRQAADEFGMGAELVRSFGPNAFFRIQPCVWVSGGPDDFACADGYGFFGKIGHMQYRSLCRNKGVGGSIYAFLVPHVNDFFNKSDWRVAWKV